MGRDLQHGPGSGATPKRLRLALGRLKAPAAEVHRAACSRVRGDTPGSFRHSGEAQRRNQRIEVFLMAIG
jgi:hypothetical protein